MIEYEPLRDEDFPAPVREAMERAKAATESGRILARKLEIAEESAAKKTARARSRVAAAERAAAKAEERMDRAEVEAVRVAQVAQRAREAADAAERRAQEAAEVLSYRREMAERARSKVSEEAFGVEAAQEERAEKAAKALATYRQKRFRSRAGAAEGARILIAACRAAAALPKPERSMIVLEEISRRVEIIVARLTDAGLRKDGDPSLYELGEELRREHELLCDVYRIRFK